MSESYRAGDKARKNDCTINVCIKLRDFMYAVRVRQLAEMFRMETLRRAFSQGSESSVRLRARALLTE